MAEFANPFSIRLTRRQVSDLDSLVVYDGLSRQELIRRGVDEYIERRRQALLAQANAQHPQVPAPVPPVTTAPVPSPAGPAAVPPPAGNPGPPRLASSRKATLKVARR